MEKYLITQSLLSAWLYMMTCREECQDEAKQDFLDALHRLPKETTPEMQNGIDFENEVYKEAADEDRDPHDKWEAGIKAVATQIRGAQTQVKLSRELTLGENTFLVYGILDALKAGVIYDVKFNNKGFHSADLANKYINSPQHSTYFYLVPEAIRFEYLVSDGADIYTEKYTPQMTEPLENIIGDFISYLSVSGNLDTYKELWVAK